MPPRIGKAPSAPPPAAKSAKAAKAPAPAGKAPRPPASAARAAPTHAVAAKSHSAAPAAKTAPAGKAVSAAKVAPAAKAAAIVSSGSTANALRPGMRMRCVGLQSCAELNGTPCTLEEFVSDVCRWIVKFADGSKRRLKADNVVPIGQQGAAPAKAGAAQAVVPKSALAAEVGSKRKLSAVEAAATSQPAKRPKGKAPGQPPIAGKAGSSSSSTSAAKPPEQPSLLNLAKVPNMGNGSAAASSGANVPKPRGRPPKVVADPAAKAKAKAKGAASSPAAENRPACCLPAPPSEPARKRLKRKTAKPDESVAFLLRRMAALGEVSVDSKGDGKGDDDDEKTKEKVDKILATAMKELEKSAAAETKAAEVKAAPEEELEGEGERRPAVEKKVPEKKKAEGEEDDELYDANEDVGDLDGEEDISDISDIADEDADDLDFDEDWEAVGALPYPDVWTSEGHLRPGDQGFNKYAASCLQKVGLGTERSPWKGLGLRLHQESVACIVHPKSPIARLMVDHATGTGKTLIMIRLLDNFFDDPRPKVAIFPKDRVCDNFYMELMKWPSRWRDFFAFSCPDQAELLAGTKHWKKKRSEMWDLNNERLRHESKRRLIRQEKLMREMIDAMRQALEMKNCIRKGVVRPQWAKKFMQQHPGAGVPRAPLRAFRYTTAGGRASDLGEDGWPRSPILKVGFDPKELNPYSGKVVIMDEVHNLVRPTAQFEEQLGKLRTYLYGAKRTVLAGFTGTPVGNDASEGRRLLDVLKGEGANQCSDEGFISSFHARGSADFCQEVPVKGIPDGIIHEGMFEDLVKRHSLHGEALKRYLLKETEFAIVPRLLRLPEEKRQARLSNYCNMHVHYGRCFGNQKDALIKDVKDHAPKMHAIAKSISKSTEKCVVMLAREMGFKTMLEVLKRSGQKAGYRVATLDELTDFNDPRKNLHGERFRVMLAETSQAGEGVQFKHVRRIYLADVPLRHSDLVQRTSRCVRMMGHADLPPEERKLAVELHMAHLPKFLKKGPGSLIYRELLNAKEVHNTPGVCLEQATLACLEELRKREVETLEDLQKIVQAEDGEKVIDMITEIALENLGDLSGLPARPVAMALWRLRKGGDDLKALEAALVKSSTADDTLVEWLIDKSAELLPPLEAMRLGAVDRTILAPLGDPPKAPPPRSEAARKKNKKALAALKADVLEGKASTVEAAAAAEGEGERKKPSAAHAQAEDGAEEEPEEEDLDLEMDEGPDIDAEELVDDEEAKFLAELEGDIEAADADGADDDGGAEDEVDNEGVDVD